MAAIFPLGGVCPWTAQASLLARTLGDGLGLTLGLTLGDGLGLTVGVDEHALSRISMPAIQAMNECWVAMVRLGRNHPTSSCAGEVGFPPALGFGI
ncbi:MAG: hypothetical protein ACJ8CB_22550 [Ktedonobacteraceae bacterium]